MAGTIAITTGRAITKEKPHAFSHFNKKPSVKPKFNVTLASVTIMVMINTIITSVIFISFFRLIFIKPPFLKNQIE